MPRSYRDAVAVLIASATLGAAACSSDSPTGGAGGDADGRDGSSAGSGPVSGAAGSAGGAGGLLEDVDGGAGRAESSDATPLPDGSCGESTLVASSKPVSVLLVIDRSGSMTAIPTGFITDKWTAMKTAVRGVLENVKDISFGLELFPNSLTTPIPRDCGAQCWDVPPGDSAVVVPVAAGVAHVTNIVDKLDTTPSGGTPTASALEAAYAYFQTGAGQAITGDRYVLLATDGGPNGALATSCDRATCTTNIDRDELGADKPNYCDAQLDPAGPRACLDEAGTLTQLRLLAAAGIKTFVVGIPGSEPYVPTLDHFAEAGGAAATATPRYYAVSAGGGVEGLTATFTAIAKRLITTCSLQLQAIPPDVRKLNVKVDDAVVPQGADGWALDSSTTPPTVILEGATCDKVQAVGAQSVQIVFGCPTAVIN